MAVSYTHLRAHETSQDLVCRLLLEKKKLNTGSFTDSSVTWLLLVVAAFAMLVGTKNHLFIGIRSWLIIGIGFFTVWLVDQGWWSGRVPEQETLFVIVAVGIAWASAVSTAGIGSDLTNPLLKKVYLRKISIVVAGDRYLIALIVEAK